jgi:hypothetical protein
MYSKNSFQWEIQDEAGPLRRLDDGPPPPPSRRRLLVRGALVLVLVALIGWGFRAWVQDRLETAGKIEQELRAVVELELRSIAQEDAELFIARQDRADPAWRVRQINRYITPGGGRFVPAPWLTRADRPPEIGEIELSGRGASVQITYWYLEPPDPLPSQLTHQPSDQTGYPTANPPPEPVPFTSNWFYRRADDGNWYHTSPPDDYLGLPHFWYGSRLDIHATGAEAELLSSTTSDLASTVAQVCRLLDCPVDVHYTLSFEDTIRPRVEAERWVLPAPYLAGLPTNQAAREAWQRLVRAWLVEAMVQAHERYDELSTSLIYQGLAARLRAEMDLAAQPEPDVELLRRALQAGEAHGLWELWEARYDTQDADETRLLQAEVTALLDYTASQMADGELLRWMGILQNRYQRADVPLFARYKLDRESFSVGWYSYLSGLTAVSVTVPTPVEQTIFPLNQGLPPAPEPLLTTTPPGDDLAFVCDGQIWVSDADVAGLSPLTTENQRFAGLQWSPDGRWLLTTWLPDVSGQPSALYLLAADGSEGHLLTENPAAHILPLGWSPNAQTVVYAVWHPVGTFPTEIRSLDLETGEARQLPGVPTWSPDGLHLSYIIEPSGGAWLARGDWENAQLIAEEAWTMWQGDNWSPDSSRVALHVVAGDPAQSAIAVYDLQSERLSPLTTSSDLTSAFLSFEGDPIGQRAGRNNLGDEPFRWLWPFGWSSDGDSLVVWAHRSDEWSATGMGPSGVAVLTVEGAQPQPLAFGPNATMGRAEWSPTHPDRLTFTWLSQDDAELRRTAYLYEVGVGPLYASPRSEAATWSPDGAWVAFSGGPELLIVDQTGQLHFAFKPGGRENCADLVWNPSADLSQLP